ncbi:hypothetical protein [Streptomyces sp. Tu 4128]|uniref:hypothetical protein n=1 Tax=Streptomyces sp. Tu 4128 TaxID=1120314 RepID=UPI0013CECD80|nr:hypothetical protein [Streptomyces sp. Tu 4128]
MHFWSRWAAVHGPRGPRSTTVELYTAEEIDLLNYGPGPGSEVVDVSVAPAALVDEES